MARHVFISYSRHDDEYALALADRLTAGGVEVWIDGNISHGRHWTRTLRNRVETCAVFLLVATPAAADSHWVGEEILLARNTGRTIVPLLIKGEPFFGIQGLQCVDLRDGSMPDDVFVASLRDDAPLQTMTAGAPSAEVLGPLGTAGLLEALAQLPGVSPMPAHLDQHALDLLRQWIVALDPSPEAMRALLVLDDLGFAIATRLFLHRALPDALTSRALRLGLTAALRDPHRPALASEADFVEHIPLAYPANEPNCKAALTRFALTIALDAGRDLAVPEIQEWVVAAGAMVLANDLIEVTAERRRSLRLRLVVSLHASFAGGWPDSLSAWLLKDDELCERADFECTPDQSGVEGALCAAVDWGEDHADARNLLLRRLEIAVPAALAPSWRPERVANGPMLGVDYDVVMRWSQRINPPRNLNWINRQAAKRLGEIEAGHRETGEPTVHWLAPIDVSDPVDLHQRLQSGRYAGAIALAGQRLANARLLDQLLPFTPILLWPDDADVFDPSAASAVAERWESLPEGFAEAYRALWRGDASQPLSVLRAVWDDHQWLAFCRSMRAVHG